MERHVVKALFWRLGCASKRQFLTVLICVSIPYLLVALLTASTLPTMMPKAPMDANKKELDLWSGTPPQPYHSLFTQKILPPRTKLSIFYYPATEDTKAIMGDFQQRIEPNMIDVIASNYSNVGDMEKYLSNDFETNEYSRNPSLTLRTGYGIIFNQVSKTKLSYTLRVAKGGVWQTAILLSTENEWKNYFEFGFITVQSGVNMGYMKYLNMTVGNWSYKRFPPLHGSTDENSANEQIIYELNEALFQNIILGFLPLIFTFVGQIVTEKSSGARELLRLNGVNDVGIYGYWFVYIILQCLVVMTALVLLFNVNLGFRVWMPNSNPILVWTFLMLFSIHLSFIIFAISSLFNNATIAALFSAVAIWTLTVLMSRFEKPTGSIVGFLYVMTPMGAFRHGLNLISFLEKLEVGIHFNNLFSAKSDKEAGPMLVIILGMIMGSIIFTLVFIYLDQVKPGEFGTAKPWHFIFGSNSRS